MQPLVTRFDRHLPVDVRHVAETAEVLGVHEIDVFKLAHRWSHQQDPSAKTLDEVFSKYLLEEIVPPWVRHFCRKVLSLDARDCLNPHEFGADKLISKRLSILDQRFAAFVTLLAFLAYIIFLV